VQRKTYIFSEKHWQQWCSDPILICRVECKDETQFDLDDVYVYIYMHIITSGKRAQ